MTHSYLREVEAGGGPWHSAIYRWGEFWVESGVTQRLPRDSSLDFSPEKHRIFAAFRTQRLLRNFCDMIGTIYEGTSNMQLQTIAKLLLK